MKMNKCPFCKQEIKTENTSILLKINGKPQRILAKKNISKGLGQSLKDSKGVRKSIYILEVETKHERTKGGAE